jgi:outer membrane lipoprotein carrier protein
MRSLLSNFFRCSGLWCCSTMLLAAPDASQLFAHQWQAIHSLQADFTQTVSQHHKRISTEHGHMLLLRPGKFRWETQHPVMQLLVADGQKIWIYDQDLEQVTVRSQAQAMRGTPALFLSSSNQSIIKDYVITLKHAAHQEIYDLTPKNKGSSFTHMQFLFQESQLVTIILDDQLGQTTRIVLSQLKQNAPLSSKLFHFSPPKGVDVIRES